MTSHWGELPILPDTESGIAAIEREQMTKPRPMEIEGPPLHQPSSKHYPPSQEPYPAELFDLDPITLHTIQLIQHSRKLRLMIQQVHQQLDSQKTEGELSFQPVPPMPEYSGPPPKHSVQTAVPFLPRDADSDRIEGLGVAPPEIDCATNRRLLRRSVAALCAHAGYDNCGDSILETLTDISHEYLLQMTQLLRRAVDSEALHGNTGFQDTMHQVFHEMGIGSFKVLHDFYQKRIINYHVNMQQTCRQLMEEYERVTHPQYEVNEDAKNVKVKEEPISDIQFPVMDESEELIDPEQLLQLEGMGLDINVIQDAGSSLAGEEETKWPQHVKPESSDTKVGTLESLDREETQSLTASTPQTPHPGSEAGDSIENPGSVTASDIMSPPSIGTRPSKPMKKKKR